MTKSSVFFGWWLLAGLFVIYMVTNGIVLNTLPIFYPALAQEFGWTPDQVTLPAQLLFLAVAIFSPFIGILLDRYSSRRVMIMGSVLLLVAFFGLSQLQSLAHMTIIYVVLALAITTAGIVPSMRIITRWFARKRGIAVGILLVASSLGGAIFNQVAGGAITTYGWRTAILILGAIAVLMVVLPLLLLVRDSPQEMGLSADGDEYIGDAAAAQSLSSGPTFSETVRSGQFYLILFITGVMWFCIVGVIQHQALFITGLDTTVEAKDVLSLFFLCSIVGKLLFGWLSDHYSKRNIMFVAVLNLLIGAVVLRLVEQAPDTLLWVYALVFGVGFSGTFTMIQLLVAEYYTGAAYGRLLGIVTMVDTMAGVLGILILGQIRTGMGTYIPAFTLLIVLSALAAVAVLALRKPDNYDPQT